MNIQQISAGERPYTGEDSLEWLRKCVKEGPQVFEWLAKGRDGKHFWVEISLKQAAVGGVDCTLAVVRDISKRKDAELELSEYRTHLEKMVRQRTAELEAKNRELETFTYSVSHDLKAPLRGIDGYSRLLEEDYSDKLDEEGLLFIKNVRLSAGRMNQLIEDLLAYSRMERRQIIPVGIDIYALIEGILCQRARDIESNGIRVRVDLPFQTVNTDPPTLLQVLDNYIDNAVKFSKKLAPGSVEVGGREDQNSWTLWVKDNGIGFDPVYHDRIFGIFQRLHRPEDFPGTGVGLAIVYKAAERINARVWAQSKVNEGATFFIAIPKKISVERSLVDI